MLKLRLMFLFVIVTGFLVSSCTTLSSSDSKDPRVVHTVVCWLKKPGDVVARRALVETSKTFMKIPGVLDVRAGEVLPDNRPMVDSSFDVAVTLYFENEQALRDYEKHPIHLKAVQEKLIPLVRKFVIYDFVEK
jgi:hypothetical protein